MKLPVKPIIFLLFLVKQLPAQEIDVKHVTLDLKFNWEKKQAFGNASISFVLLAAANSIHLDAGMLTIHSIILSNGRNLHFNYDGGDRDNGLEINLDKHYGPGETITMDINYHTNYQNNSDPNNIGGSFGKGIRFFQPTSATPTKRKQIWSSGEPQNNCYWFPCNEDIADIHTTTFIATVEKPLMVIANGNLVKIKENQDDTRTFHYEAQNPYPNYLTSFVAGEYFNVQQHAGNIPINTFGYPDEKEAVKATVELLPAMMEFISRKTGYPYPYRQYTQVVVQDYPFPGLNGQHGVSTISDNYIDDYGVHKDWKYLWDGVAAQALASQWFGNTIMPKSWNDIWLNNAFTQYFAGLYTAEKNGKEEYLTYYLPFEKGNVLNDWNTGYKHPLVVTEMTDLNSFTPDNYSKYRGALILRMLQKELGEYAWWKAIQHYVKANAGRQVTTIDFQKAIEQSTGKSYSWFFDQWIYKIGLPKFEISNKYDATNKQLTIRVKQVQQPDSANEYSQAEYFGGKVEIEINDKIEWVTIKPKAENNFVFRLAEAPGLINFDHEDTWLCEKTVEKTFGALLYQAENDISVAGRISAIDDLTILVKKETTSHKDKELVYDVLKNQITSNHYWRYRLYALTTLRNILPMPYNETTISLLSGIIKKDKPWLKVSALFMLGNTMDEKYSEIYINALHDESDRVVNAAAIALGKTKNAKAFDILLSLDKKPSWKSQSRISALNGMQQLADARVIDFALECLRDNQSPRWFLATATWDYPFAAATTLAALGKGHLGYPIIFSRFKKSLEDNDLNDIFQHVQLIIILADPGGQEIFELLKVKYKDDVKIMQATIVYETRFKEVIKK